MMGKRIGLVVVLALGVAALVCGRAATAPKQGAEVEEEHGSRAEAEVDYWTCGMHPTVRVTPEAYEAGETKCPICRMDLIPVASGAAGGDVTVALSPAQRRLASIRTFSTAFLPLVHEIRAVGVVGYDERNVAHISARVPGRVERLYVSFAGERVRQGDPLALVYSPALVSAQEEYLLALATRERVAESPVPEARANAAALVESSRNRLLLWGVTAEQVDRIARTGSTETQLTIHSPQSGTVLEKHVLEGEYVKEGQMLYRIADLSSLWVLADVYEEEIPWLATGQSAEITAAAFPGERFEGRVAFVDPFLSGKTRSLKVRVDLANPDGRFKPEMFVDVTLRQSLGKASGSYWTCPMHPDVVADEPGDCPECGMDLVKVAGGLALAIPKTAVLDVGRRKLVYVDKGDGRYEQREVAVGPEGTVAGESERYFPVVSGVAEGERVVVNANFLIDSQTQLTGQAAGAYGGALEAGADGQ